MGLFQSRDKLESKETVKEPYPSPRLHAQEHYDYNAQFVASDRRMFNHYRLIYERSILREETRDPRDDGTLKITTKLLHDHLRKLGKIQAKGKELLGPSRARLQQRYNEEAAFLSEARSEDAHPYGLPRPVCEYIASMNNKPTHWDEPLKEPPYTGGSEKSQQSTTSRRRLGG